jgi:hypothetical protein
MKKTYVITKTVKVPFVVNTPQPHRPADIRYKTFRKGEMVQGELKHANNKPAFVLVGKMGVLPLNCIQEVSSKPIAAETSSAEGNTQAEKADAKNKEVIVENPKVRYADAFIIGAFAGFVGTHLAMKQGWIPDEDKKYKLYGALGVGVIAMYLVYRNQSSKKTAKITVKSNKE